MAKKEKRADVAARHERFVREYLIDYNGRRAYQAAFPTCKDTHAAEVGASRLLRQAEIRSRVDELEAAAVEDLGLRKHRILREQARIAFSDGSKLLDENGCLVDIATLDADTRAAIASIEVVELFEGKGKERVKVGELKKVKLWNKNEAGANLMKHAGLFKADNDQKGSVLRDFMEAVSGKSRGLPGRYQP